MQFSWSFFSFVSALPDLHCALHSPIFKYTLTVSHFEHLVNPISFAFVNTNMVLGCLNDSEAFPYFISFKGSEGSFWCVCISSSIRLYTYGSLKIDILIITLESFWLQWHETLLVFIFLLFYRSLTKRVCLQSTHLSGGRWDVSCSCLLMLIPLPGCGEACWFTVPGCAWPEWRSVKSSD